MFKCDICNKSFQDKGEFYDHYEEEHKGKVIKFTMSSGS